MIIILLPFEFNAYVFVSREDIRESFIHNLKFLLEFIERGTISQFKKLNNASIAFGSEFLCSFHFEFGISEGSGSHVRSNAMLRAISSFTQTAKKSYGLDLMKIVVVVTELGVLTLQLK